MLATGSREARSTAVMLLRCRRGAKVPRPLRSGPGHWAGNPVGDNLMIELRNLLLAVDFSDTCLKATEYAVALASRFGATLHLLHVIEDPVVYLPMFESYPLPSREQFETYAQDRLENWIPNPEAEGLKLEMHFRHGAPHIEIIDYRSEE